MIATIILGGCRIELDVPHGGSVETASGLYACAGNEICYIDVDHPYFEESFFVVAEDGYEFDIWAEGNKYLCGGKKNSCSLSTLEFPKNANLMSVLRGDQEFYLSPRFRKTYYQPAVPDDGWKMVSFHKQENYLVEGDSQREIFDAIQSPANPLNFNPATGRKPSGNAFYSSYHRWTYRYDGDGCRVVNFQFEATYTTYMPQLKNLENKRHLLKEEWKDWYRRLMIHEAGHQAINRKQYAKQLEALKTMKSPWDRRIGSMSECAAAVRDRRLEITRPISLETESLHAEYHEMVGSIIPW